MLIRLFITLFAALLTACASGPTHYRALADDQIPKNNKNGIVFLRVTNGDLSSASDLRENSLALIPLYKSKAKTDVVVIDALDDGGSTSSSYLAALPPGVYTVLGVGRHTPYVRSDLTLKKPIGTFTVRAGDFVNLGTLIINKDRVMRSPAEVPPPKLWQSQFPNLYRQLMTGRPAQWDERNANIVSLEQLAKPPTSSLGWIELDNNVLALPGPLGIVRIRGAQGIWQDISLHNTAGVLSYARSSSGVEFAALEYQQLYSRDPGVSAWTEVAAPAGSGMFGYAKFTKNGLLYLLMTELDGSVKIYSTTASAVQWHLVGNIAPPVNVLSMLPGRKDPAPRVSITAAAGDTVFITQVSFGIPGSTLLTRFDCTSNTAQQLAPPFTMSHTTQVSYSNGITSAYDFADSNRFLYKSFDNGGTWQAHNYDARKTPGGRSMLLTSAVKFIDKNIGFATFDNRLLMRTDDGGKNWSAVKPLTKYEEPISLVVGGSPNELLVLSEGHYKVSLDLGQSWKIEY